MKKITKILTLGALSAVLAIYAAAADGGIVDVDTRLNVRTSASSTASVKTKLWDGQVITLLEKSGNWWYVEYAPDSFGYVSANYINELNLKTAAVNISSGTLNVRAGASLSAKITDKLYKGEEVLILGTYGDFYKVLYNGNLVGYAAKAYLTTASSESGTYSAVSLTVPSYKQFNYSSLKLPGSGESIATHGCAVTSLAMTESYRTGAAVTPKTVVQNQKFTSSGALYWPSAYAQGSTSLSHIYSKLKSGSPVIVHVQTKGGSSHFAVITGFSGGALTANNFKISDPGSYSRTTLADLLAAYPKTIKTLSY
ncbi:MAG: SH3 domain-containing protein [Clostridia bacterium]|nr:SH3 domain-containing protein [Clostridia bacterium]